MQSKFVYSIKFCSDTFLYNFVNSPHLCEKTQWFFSHRRGHYFRDIQSGGLFFLRAYVIKKKAIFWNNLQVVYLINGLFNLTKRNELFYVVRFKNIILTFYVDFWASLLVNLLFFELGKGSHIENQYEWNAEQS